MKTLFLSLLLFIETAYAAVFEVASINDATLNQNLQALVGNRSNNLDHQKELTLNITKQLLIHLRPQIEQLPNFDKYEPFNFNCTVLFDTNLNKAICEVTLDSPDELMDNADPKALILTKNIEQVEKNNILVTRAFVDVSSDYDIQGVGNLYLRHLCESAPQTETLYNTITPSLTVSEIVMLSKATLSHNPSITPNFAQTKTNTLAPCPSDYACSAVATVDPVGSGFKTVPPLIWDLSVTSNTWQGAQNYCAQKGGGWRLSDIWELYALYQQRTIVLGSSCDTSYFWSSTSSGNGAWGVTFGSGRVSNSPSLDLFRVRCCRSDGN